MQNQGGQTTVKVLKDNEILSNAHHDYAQSRKSVARFFSDYKIFSGSFIFLLNNFKMETIVIFILRLGITDSSSNRPPPSASEGIKY